MTHSDQGWPECSQDSEPAIGYCDFNLSGTPSSFGIQLQSRIAVQSTAAVVIYIPDEFRKDGKNLIAESFASFRVGMQSRCGFGESIGQALVPESPGLAGLSQLARYYFRRRQRVLRFLDG